MKILLDMNISPAWQPVLMQAGIETVHWSAVGSPDAKDKEILNWACDNGHVIFTHDLDFGAILAATHANAPSVIQIREQDITPESASELFLHVVQNYQREILDGALISVDAETARLRLLPLNH